MKRTLRWTVYLLGMLFLAFGIALSGKTGLGLSPISAVAFSISELSGLNYGDMTFALYALFVVAQFALRGRNSRVIDLLQLVVSLLFSRVLNVFVALINYDGGQHGFAMNFALLLLAIVFIGIGVSGSLKMNLIPNPGDGIVEVLAARMNWELGFAKNVLDIGCVCVTMALGLVFAHRLVGVGIGTVVAMLGVGRVVALTNRLVMKKLCVAAGVA